MNVYRITLANTSLDLAASLLQSRGIDATLTQSVGVGSWGRENGIAIESATADPAALLDAVLTLLVDRGEDCAYVTIDGASPRLWHKVPAASRDFPYAIRSERL